MKKLIIVAIITLVFSCKKEQTVTVNKSKEPAVEKPSEIEIVEKIEEIEPLDLIFLGEPLISDKEFIYNLSEGGDNYKYFDEFEKILSKSNNIFYKWKEGETKVNKQSDLSLELRRLKYQKKDNKKDIQIMLYVVLNGVKKDSIMFYKYQIDKEQSFYPDQRHEVLNHMDNKLNIYHLETFTNQSEFALAIEKWSKLSINKKTGKIDMVMENLDYNN